MNDILIYNKIFKQHKKHIRQVLIKLREAGLQVDIEKSQFHKAKVKFLDLFVRIDNIRISSNKVQIILNWDFFETLKHVQIFIRFCNFYRRFIKDFFKVVKFFYDLIKKNVKFK